MRIAVDRCAACHGTGTVDVLTPCCAHLSPYGKDCGCNGYIVDRTEICACTEPVRVVPGIVIIYCPACDGQGKQDTKPCTHCKGLCYSHRRI